LYLENRELPDSSINNLNNYPGTVFMILFIEILDFLYVIKIRRESDLIFEEKLFIASYWKAWVNIGELFYLFYGTLEKMEICLGKYCY
jgi:hypothetical protein